MVAQEFADDLSCCLNLHWLTMWDSAILDQTTLVGQGPQAHAQLGVAQIAGQPDQKHAICKTFSFSQFFR
jgi:hypothetical protein